MTEKKRRTTVKKTTRKKTTKKTFSDKSRKKLLVTDPHVHFHAGNEIFVDTALSVLKEARDIAVSHGMDFLCLGDVFYLKDSVDGVIFLKTWELFEKFKDMKTYFLYGNHDLIMKEDANYNLLATFKDNINVVIPYQKVIEDEFCFHYMSYYHEPKKFIEKNITIEPGKKNILLFHQEINGFWFNDQQRASSAITQGWLKEYGFDYVISGHIHKRQVNDFVAYIGSTHQMSWKDKGVQMGYTIMDLDKFGTPEFLTQHKFVTKTPHYVEVKLNDAVKQLQGVEGAFVKIILDDKQQKEMSPSRKNELVKQFSEQNFGISFASPKSKDSRELILEGRIDAVDLQTQLSPVSILEGYLDKIKTEEPAKDLMEYLNNL